MPPQIVSIAHNAVVAKLIDPSKEAKAIVQDALTYTVAGSENTQAFRTGGWDGKASFFDYLKCTFPRGFVTYVQARLKAAGISTRVVKKPLPAPLGPERPRVDAYEENPRYDYQWTVLERLLSYGQIIAQVATGGGKSRIAKICTARINRPTLFLTTRSVLLHQMADQYRDMERKVAILGDSKMQISSDVTCAMVQTVISWLKEPECTERQDPAAYARQMKRRQNMLEALSRFEFVILEEAHEVSSNSFYDVLKACTNAHYRLALTATPFMKDDEEANMRLMASAGHIAIKVSEKMLIERGILAKPYFKYVSTPKPEKLYRSSPWQRAYELGIVENDARNRHIIAEVKRASLYGLGSMVLVQRKAHGEALRERMERNGLRAEFIFGDSDQTERALMLGKLGRKEIDALIGTTILDVGVDVPAVGVVILGGGGKAEVALRQRIGRGLREKRDGSPNVCFIVDFLDEHNNTLRSHANTRKAIVESTPGFAENVVKDFAYDSLGFTRAEKAAAA